MADDTTKQEAGHADKLNENRAAAEAQKKLASLSRLGKKKDLKTPGAIVGVGKKLIQKIPEHWLILSTAVFFDLISLIPYVGLITIPTFSMILFLNFGPKSKGGSELTKIALPSLAAWLVDATFSEAIAPNTATALIRIALN